MTPGAPTGSAEPKRRELRRAARLALYGSLALTGVVAAALFPLARTNLELSIAQYHGTDFASLVEVQRLQRLISIDTTDETGSELEAANYMAELISEVGLESTIEEFPGGKANLWAIIEGKSPRALVLHNHIDTDPVIDPSVWRHPPFSGAIEGPWIFGRGAFDMKSVTIAQLEAFLETKRRVDERGTPPERSLIFLATSSEETGSDLGARWLIAQHPELISRFDTLLTEGGVVEATDSSSIKYWGTSFSQKRFVNVWARSTSRERLEQLLEDVRDLGQPAPLRLTPEVEGFLASYAKTRENPEIRVPLQELDELFRKREWFEGLPPYLQSLFRDEIHPFPIAGEEGSSDFRMRLIVHLLPGSDLDEALEILLPDWLTAGLEIQYEQPPGAGFGSPIDGQDFLQIQKTLADWRPGVVTGPYFLSYFANDSRFFRETGANCYGFSPFVAITMDSMSMTGPDERLALPAFLEGVELYERLVGELVELPPS